MRKKPPPPPSASVPFFRRFLFSRQRFLLPSSLASRDTCPLGGNFCQVFSFPVQEKKAWRRTGLQRGGCGENESRRKMEALCFLLLVLAFVLFRRFRRRKQIRAVQVCISPHYFFMFLVLKRKCTSDCVVPTAARMCLFQFYIQREREHIH